MKEVTAAGGVLFRENEVNPDPEVLLIFRRGVWDLPKGKLDSGESIEECARREVSEEVGCKYPEIHSRLNDTYHEYEEDRQLIGKTTHWFVMTLLDNNEELQPEKKEGIEKLEWVKAPDALEQVGYDNLVNVIKDFLKWYSAENIS